MTEAGGEDGEEDGEHHDGEANHHATNTTFPGMRQHCLLEKEVVSYGDFLRGGETTVTPHSLPPLSKAPVSVFQCQGRIPPQRAATFALEIEESQIGSEQN